MPKARFRAFEPRRRNGALKKSQKSRPLPPDGSLVVRRPETLAEALLVGPDDDWIHGPAIDAIRTAEKRGHSSPIAAKDRAAGRLVAPFALDVPIGEAFYLLQPTIGTAHPDADLFKAWLLAALPQDRL